jgi:hypothetical protein
MLKHYADTIPKGAPAPKLPYKCDQVTSYIY